VKETDMDIDGVIILKWYLKEVGWDCRLDSSDRLL
jgi:hypothetical protein